MTENCKKLTFLVLSVGSPEYVCCCLLFSVFQLKQKRKKLGACLYRLSHPNLITSYLLCRERSIGFYDFVWEVNEWWFYFPDVKLCMFSEHKSYVQGVSFDPLGDLVATLSPDRYILFFYLIYTVTANSISLLSTETSLLLLSI